MGKPKSNSKVSQGGVRKIPVTLNKEQLERILVYKGIMGNKPAEIIRNIVINWLLGKDEK